VIPSLIARELKASIVEYLATTFALSDEEAYQALTEFLLDSDDGIFRGPYLRVRLPFVEAQPDANLGVVWKPASFRPYVHQLLAWQRLGGRGNSPQSTVLTTGTGSGKSEAFLIPIIDHAIWARGRGQRGIKALLLYPMNALVADQERRIAGLLNDPVAQAAGVRAGVWIGNDDSLNQHRAMDSTHLITNSDELQRDPPDILLTNYKMLDRLLTSGSRQRLWASNTPTSHDTAGWKQPLTYLVLDEFHTYNGAQGTDVAMLLRRLGHRLGIATLASPLSGVGCVGTSATLGTSVSDASVDLCSFASRIFGVRFDASAIIGEKRRSVADVCADIDFSLPVPEPKYLLSLDQLDLDGLAEAFTGVHFDDAQAVGDRLIRHRLTASLLRVAGDQPRQWGDAVASIAQQIPEWGDALTRDAASVEAALEHFVALISQARGRTGDGGSRALFSVEVQLWIREVTRLKRAISLSPKFRWADASTILADTSAELELPSIYCTACGRSGWLGVANRASGRGAGAIERLVYDHTTDPYQASVRDRDRTRAILRANKGEPDLLWLDSVTGQVHADDDKNKPRIPVLVAGWNTDETSEVARDEAAKRQECPSCNTHDAIRFLGSRITTLASVGITQMFGSDLVADNERKLLAFTDSVQDASHRAAFFSGRTHRFNLRATLSAALQSTGRLALPSVAETVLARASDSEHPLDDLFSLVPPDLLWEDWLGAAWKAPESLAGYQAREGLAKRLSFDAVLEAGLRSRLGRTLETTGTAIAEVQIDNNEWSQVVSFVTEALGTNTLLAVFEPETVRTWAEGVIERLRLRGGIFHPFLDRYVAEHGKRWFIWGGGDPLAPKFPRGLSAPAFFASTPSDEFDPIGGPKSWVRLWSKKVLGIDGPGVDHSLRDLLHILSDVGVIEARVSPRGTVWGIPSERVEFVDIASSNSSDQATQLRCDVCAHPHYTTPEGFARWSGRPCLRLRCPGSYIPAATQPTNYYRNLYRSGKIRRVVAEEDTGLLTRKRREDVEIGFKDGGRPDAPNVIAATPTLELGIDIGDLSAVMLTSVPPTQTNYVQRVGRAGRTTGNAFVTTFAEGDPRSLYFLHDPQLMIAGEIIAPSCRLDAIEILRRQYLAFLVDRAAEGTTGPIPDAGQMPRNMGALSTIGFTSGGWMTKILDTGEDPAMVQSFVRLFGQNLDPSTAQRLEAWATTEMRSKVERVVDRWRSHLRTLINQRDRLRDREQPLTASKHPTPEETEALGRIVAELRYVAHRITRTRNEDTLGGLEALGLLPNYTLYDDTVTLEVNLWRPNDDRDTGRETSSRFSSDSAAYVRSASVAIRELAPGNYFYVDAHRVRIDAVDNGTEHEPMHASWRFCPKCAWASDDASATSTTCPRCGSIGVADQGSVFTVLPMKTVSSTEREMTARVSDDNEDRDRVWHEVITTVDIDQEDITAAYVHANAVFGIESVRAARILYLNLGPRISPSGQTRQVQVDGKILDAPLFQTCRYCGGVFGIRGDVRQSDDRNHHRSWCMVRSGARKAHWDYLILSHELVTEAIRILLPVSEFETLERVLSFKAALLLGLRDSFGGDSSHLGVLLTSFPAPGNNHELRNSFVVVHDTVPGGTGYLRRLGDPDQLRKILLRAVELIASCECQTRGQPGCHRCLYGSVGRNEIPLVSRDTALTLLDEILTAWKLEPATNGTITGANLSRVRQSELERMFKALLLRWSGDPPARVTSRPDTESAELTRFDIHFRDGPHWEIREQVSLAAHGTIPDFYCSRVDSQQTEPVAIYLDGWEFHGNSVDRTDQDSQRRASVRQGGTSVWTLTWDDVKEALEAVSRVSPLSSTIAFSPTVRHHATQGAKESYGSDHPVFKAVEMGAFDQLMCFLRYPDASPWRSLAQTTAIALCQGGSVLSTMNRQSAVDAAAVGDAIVPVRDETGIVALTSTSQGGQSLTTIIERDSTAAITAVLSYDTNVEPNRARWSNWLHLANLLQHLKEHAIVTTTRSYVPFLDEDSPQMTPTGVPDHTGEILADVFDQAALPLALTALSAGWTDLVVGLSFDEDDTPVEIAWPSAKVGILPSSGSQPATLDGWDLRVPRDWTVDALLKALMERSD